MEISPAARVGMVFVVALVMLFFIMSFLGIWKKEPPGTYYYVVFDNVSGLQVGARVLKSGVNVGKVHSINIIGEREPKELLNKVRVILFLREGEAITKESSFTISTNLMGEKWLEIYPRGATKIRPAKISANRPWQEDYGIGTTPVTMDDLIVQAKNAIGDLELAVNNFNDLMEDGDIQNDLKESMENIKGLAGNLRSVTGKLDSNMEVILFKVAGVVDNADAVVRNVDRQLTAAGADVKDFTGSLRRMAVDNEQSVHDIVANLNATSANLNLAMCSLQEIVADEKFGSSILTTLEQIAATSEEIHGIASDIRSVTSDPQVKEDLKGTISGARETMDNANKLIKRVRGVIGDGEGSSGTSLIQLDAEMGWKGPGGHSAGNANLYLLPRGKHMVKVGVDDIGVDNHFNLQYGRNYGNLRPRIGVIRSDVGIGTDAFIGKNFELNVDAYDPSDVKVDILGKYIIKDGFYITGGVRDAFNGNQGIIGVGKRF